jgi:hypothetical protein
VICSGELVARVGEFLLGEFIKAEVHNQDLHSDLLGPGPSAHKTTMTCRRAAQMRT